MINTRDLPSDQCYMEYPDGSIVLVSLCKKISDFEIVTRFTPEEELNIRKELQLIG
jgi:hypothetical protein